MIKGNPPQFEMDHCQHEHMPLIRGSFFHIFFLIVKQLLCSYFLGNYKSSYGSLQIEVVKPEYFTSPTSHMKKLHD
jgi:hypothetical protein